MKYLIIWLVLLPIFTTAQIKQGFTPPFDMYFSSGKQVTPKVKAVMVFESVLFAASIYYMQTNNQKMYRYTRNAFIVSTIPLLTINFDKPRKHKRR